MNIVKCQRALGIALNLSKLTSVNLKERKIKVNPNRKMDGKGWLV